MVKFGNDGMTGRVPFTSAITDLDRQKPSGHCHSTFFCGWANDRTGDFARWRKQSAKCGIDLVVPYTLRTRHNVEIVEIKPGKGSHCVIALGNQDQLPIVDADRFVKSLIIVHSLKGEAIGWLNVMV